MALRGRPIRERKKATYSALLDRALLNGCVGGCLYRQTGHPVPHHPRYGRAPLHVNVNAPEGEWLAQLPPRLLSTVEMDMTRKWVPRCWPKGRENMSHHVLLIPEPGAGGHSTSPSRPGEGTFSIPVPSLRRSGRRLQWPVVSPVHTDLSESQVLYGRGSNLISPAAVCMHVGRYVCMYV